MNNKSLERKANGFLDGLKLLGVVLLMLASALGVIIIPVFTATKIAPLASYIFVGDFSTSSSAGKLHMSNDSYEELSSANYEVGTPERNVSEATISICLMAGYALSGILILVAIALSCLLGIVAHDAKRWYRNNS